MQRLRKAALAGTWYTANPKSLRKSIVQYLEEAQPKRIGFEQNPLALVIPHAGHQWSGSTAASAYVNIPKANEIRRVFILSPNHRMPVRGVVTDRVDAFSTPLGDVPVDSALINDWLERDLIGESSQAHRQEHAIEIQLPFLQTILEDFSIVPLIVGQLDKDELLKFSRALKESLKPNDLLVISSDFLHYGEGFGYVPFGAPVIENIRQYDMATFEAISALDVHVFEEHILKEPHCACGSNSLWVLSAVFQDSKSVVVKLDYNTSAMISGEDDMSVSYMALAVVPKTSIKADIQSSTEHNKMISQNPLQPNETIQALKLARIALNAGVAAGESTDFDLDAIKAAELDLSPVFKEEYGVFVTLKQNDELRGCIGNILPYANLARSIWGRAQDAALGDPRFEDVQPEELAHISLEISVLTRPQKVTSFEDIVIGKHGIILKKQGRTSVFLPQVAPEQGWTLEQTLGALAQKAGFSSNAWRSDTQLEVFEAQVFSE